MSSKRPIRLGLCFALGLAAPAAAEPWSRGFVVSRFEPAFYFGGSEIKTADGVRRATGAKGTDCPDGIHTRTLLQKLSITSWAKKEDIEMQANSDPGAREESAKKGMSIGAALAQRGFRPGVNTYYSMWAAIDGGMQEVGGSRADGFNLDGNRKTGGFTDAAGQAGIDNAWYRAVGCLITWRGGVAGPSLNSGTADSIRKSGAWTNTVIRISGTQNPANDPNVTVEIAWTPDGAVADASGDLADGYSFRMATGPRYTKLRGKIVNGVIETEVVPQLRTSAPAGVEPAAVELVLGQGRMRLEMTPSGGLNGLMGGYAKWWELYMADAFDFSPGTKDRLQDGDDLAEYYALRRNADAEPDEAGRNTALSTAWYISAVPAFVVDPEIPITAPKHLFPEQNRRRELFMKTLQNKELLGFDGNQVRLN